MPTANILVHYNNLNFSDYSSATAKMSLLRVQEGVTETMTNSTLYDYMKALYHAVGNYADGLGRLQDLGNGCFNAMRGLGDNREVYQSCNFNGCSPELQTLYSKLNSILLGSNNNINLHYGALDKVANVCVNSFANFTHQLMMNESTTMFVVKSASVISALLNLGS